MEVKQFGMNQGVISVFHSEMRGIVVRDNDNTAENRHSNSVKEDFRYLGMRFLCSSEPK